MTTTTAEPVPADQETQLRKLRRLNVIAGFAHLIQMVLILVLANDFSPAGHGVLRGRAARNPGSEPVVLVDIPVAAGVALFFALSALFHFLVASPLFYRRYAAGLVAQHNYFRWVEYSLSSSVMIVLIAQIVGISDVAALIAIFGVNASMILFGWLQEKYETPGEGGWLPFIFGCIAGIVPWIIIVIFVVAPGSASDVRVPGFVYGIIVSLFIFFNIFALVQWLQYKRVGRWADYLRGERTYIWLSLVAKSALAWQIFSGHAHPHLAAGTAYGRSADTSSRKASRSARGALRRALARRRADAEDGPVRRLGQGPARRPSARECSGVTSTCGCRPHARRMRKARSAWSRGPSRSEGSGGGDAVVVPHEPRPAQRGGRPRVRSSSA